MARRISARTVLNRKALDAISAGCVDGMAALGQRVIDLGAGKVPDATPFGEGLVTTGDWGIWANGKKVAGTAKKPRRVPVKQGITLVVGYDFPGRFQTLGTINIPPNPSWFVVPMNETLPGASNFIKGPVRARLAGIS